MKYSVVWQKRRARRPGNDIEYPVAEESHRALCNRIARPNRHSLMKSEVDGDAAGIEGEAFDRADFHTTVRHASAFADALGVREEGMGTLHRAFTSPPGNDNRDDNSCGGGDQRG